MRRRVSAFLAGLMVMGGALVGAAGVAGAAPGSGGVVLVRFAPGTSAASEASVHRRFGAAVTGVISGIGVEIVQVPGDAASAARGYAGERSVRYAEPDAHATVAEVPNDPSYALEWGLAKVQAPSAWGITHGSAAVTVAILDTGIQASHPDLAGKVVASKNFTSSATLDDVFGHGTHVAGIAAGVTNNAVGIAGLGWNVSVANVKVLGDNGSGAYSAIAQGITWAADNGARVINMSLGGTSASSTLQDAVNYAWNKGVVVVAAAGNNTSSAPFYPAYYSNVIAVAASNEWDQLAPYSDYGSWVDVAAPGSNIYSTLPGGTYGNRSGTSMASPQVAGLAALISGRVNNVGVRSCIESTTDNVGVNIAGGRINAYTAAACAAGGTTGATIAGTVTDVQGGTPIVGATVGDGTRSTTTDTSGAYALTNVPAGTYALTASAPGYAPASQSVNASDGSTATANFALTKVTGSVVGRVTNATTGGAIAGAMVSGGGRSTTTDTSGNYTLAGIAAGSTMITASASGYVTASQSVTVVAAGATTANFSLSTQIKSKRPRK